MESSKKILNKLLEKHFYVAMNGDIEWKYNEMFEMADDKELNESLQEYIIKNKLTLN